tara:strand:- start:41957 stop:42223 length:267 start_codon:yes stop_codon:yes gene_type:complete
MNIELAKTFIAIVSTGSFIRASERLNVAQATVSARIHTLEHLLSAILCSGQGRPKSDAGGSTVSATRANVYPVVATHAASGCSAAGQY